MKLETTGTQGQRDAIDNINALSNEQKEEALNSLSGHFISNIIKGAGREGIEEVKKRIEGKGNKDGIWVDIGMKGVKEDKDANSPDEYKEEIKGVMVGYDKNIGEEETTKIGVYGGYKAIAAKQEANKGEVNRGVVGIYAMSSRGKIDIKGIVGGSIDKYVTTREINIDNDKEKSEGKFGGMGAMAEGEIGYNGIKEGTIRPYVGARVGIIVNTKGFKEEGKNPLGLEVKDNNYLRASIRTGIRTKVEKKKVRYNMGIGIECLALGRENELKSSFGAEGTDMKIKSVEEGIIRGEGEIGIEYEVNEEVGIYAKATGGIGSYSDIGGNIGFKYAFGR
jgi:outer membrane autotransporter protein